MPRLTKGSSRARRAAGPLRRVLETRQGQRVAALGRRVARASIWDADAIPLLERKYAVPLKRVVLPAYDLIAIVAGLVAVRSGIPALERLLPFGIAAALAYGLVVVAVVAMLGISFPRFYRVEQVAKIALVSVLGLYFAAVLTVGGQSREFVAIIILFALPLPLYRLWLLGTEDRDRQAPGKGAR